MKRLRVAVVITSLTLLLAHAARAQTVCPKADEGSPCDGGHCVPGTCTIADGDGGTTEGACGLCVEVGSGQCLGYDAGPACPTGTTCNASGGSGIMAGGGSAGGGSPEAGTLVGFGYSIGSCEGPPVDSGPGDEGDDASSGDDSGAENLGGDLDGGLVSKDASVSTKDASAGHDTSTSGSSSGGCGIASTTPASSMLPLAAVLGLALVRRRRAKR